MPLPSGGCFGVKGEGIGKPCIFPFRYKDQTYHDCMSTIDWNTGNNIEVCATEIDPHTRKMTVSAICSTSCASPSMFYRLWWLTFFLALTIQTLKINQTN